MAESQSPSLDHPFHPWAQRILNHAAAIGAAAERSDALHSYSTILLAILKARDPVSVWLQNYLGGASFDIEPLLEQIGIDSRLLDTLSPDDENRKPSDKLPWTQSARQLLDDAGSYTSRGNTIRPLELVAAFVYGETRRVHESDLVEFGILDEDPQTRGDWGNAFLSMYIGQSVNDIDKWLDIHNLASSEPVHCLPCSISGTPIPRMSLGASALYLGMSLQPWRFKVEGDGDTSPGFRQSPR